MSDQEAIPPAATPPASQAIGGQYPLLPLRDVVVFPHMVIPLFVGRPKSIKAMETAMESGKSILLVAQRSAAKDEPGPEDMYEIGCVSSILQMLKLPDGTVKVLVEGAPARASARSQTCAATGLPKLPRFRRKARRRPKSKRCAARCCPRSTSTSS